MPTLTTISNSDDIIDSRDVMDRIEELEDDTERDEDDDAELAALKALAEEAANYAEDWEHGETLIRDSYFEEYAQQLAEDIGAINNDAAWPNMHIDWKAAARHLQMDYTAVDYDGVRYWIR